MLSRETAPYGPRERKRAHVGRCCAQFDRLICQYTRRRVPVGSGCAREQIAITLSPSRSMISSCNALVRVVDNRAEANVRAVR